MWVCKPVSINYLRQIDPFFGFFIFFLFLGFSINKQLFFTQFDSLIIKKFDFLIFEIFFEKKFFIQNSEFYASEFLEILNF